MRLPTSIHDFADIPDGEIYVWELANPDDLPPFEVARAGRGVLARFYNKNLAVEYAKWKGDE